MSFLAPGTPLPPSITRYLLPYEKRVVTLRRHPILLLRPGLEVFAGLIVAGVITGLAGTDSGWFITVVWLLWLVLLTRLTWKVLEWGLEYIVVTSHRILWAHGVITRKIATMPLSKVTDMSLQRDPAGQALGYGQFIIESAGQDQALRTISYVPRPEDVYQRIMAQIFPAPRDSTED